MSKELSSCIENKESDSLNSLSEKTLSNAVDHLIGEFTVITNLNKREIKSISMLQSDIILKEITDKWIENRKHLKGIYGKQLHKLIIKGFEGIGNIIQTEKQGLFQNIFNRDK